MKTYARSQRRALSPRGSAKAVQRAPARSDPAVRAMLRAPPAVTQRACAECEEEKKVQRNAAPGAARGGDVSPTVAAGTAAGGAPLPAAARSHFEGRFGRDFGGVRVHTGAEAAASARDLDARAYTFGRDIVFGAGAYQPDTAAGRRLLAHELTHVVQQGGDAAADGQVRRQPLLPQGGTKALHDAQVEEYRKAHGLPPGGIDPKSGAQVGPSDGVIRFGLLGPWLLEKSGAIDAPAKAPKLAEQGREDVRDDCRKATGNDDDWYHYCRRHRDFCVNVYPQAVANIRSVASPYSEAIAKLYASVLPAVKYLANATPNKSNFPLKTIGGYPGPLTFGATTHTFDGGFTLLLDQRVSDVVADEVSVGGGSAIRINVLAVDVQFKNFPVIESSMVHEAMHAFSRVVHARNLAGLAPGVAGLPARAPVDLNLDLSSYAGFLRLLEAAALPFVQQIQQLPSFAGRPLFKAQVEAESTARKMVQEAMARVEEAIYVKQRSGAGFTSADLAALPPFHTLRSYWEPKPPVESELEDFVTRNKDAIDRRLGPILLDVGAKYLSLRPRMDEKKVRRTPAGAARGGDVSSTVAAGVSGGGAPLPAAARSHFEPRLGRDLGDVRVHTGAAAAASASALNAHAYTFGRDVVFGAGQYDPQGAAGRRLLAHELAHVVQQDGAPGLSARALRQSVPGCDAATSQRIEAARATAEDLVAAAIVRLDNLDAKTVAIIDRHFACRAPSEFKAIGTALRAFGPAMALLSPSCVDPQDALCGRVGARLVAGVMEVCASASDERLQELFIMGAATETGQPGTSFSGLVLELGGRTVEATQTEVCGDAEERLRLARGVRPITAFDDACTLDKCDRFEGSIRADLRRAISYVKRARAALGTPGADTSSLLDWYFNDHGKATVATVAERLGCIEAALQSTLADSRYGCDFGPRDFSAAVKGQAEPCADSGNSICLAGGYFGMSERSATETLIHECGHRIGLSVAKGSDVYFTSQGFVALGRAEALLNTDSYAQFVSAVVLGARRTWLLGGGGGLGRTLGSGEARDFWSVYAALELQHPKLGIFSPTAGLSVTNYIGADAPGALSLYSLVAGVRIADQRPGRLGGFYLHLYTGPSIAVNQSGQPGDLTVLGWEAGAAVGFRSQLPFFWGTRLPVDLSVKGTLIYDPFREEGNRGVYSGGAQLTLPFTLPFEQ